ncbi:3'-5' exoribonuclease domain-containing protein [Mycolicibacterium sphagni]|uniref:3'-5' exoribonuclease domain-containing protein n=1 Tax=Mycolicibacterium sphagni TaxID=1786 RepID=UPI0021F37273|nr:3'-5' exoribonuclease [Mycolicibacterium sphagni]MCV7175109.1 3'-5' exoribonuclease [Mycolicibacterium sphagni]
MTRYFYDTEFLDDGSTIELISIGIVCEDGREYYAVNFDCDFRRICKDDWLWDNVVRHLPTTKTDWSDDALQRGRGFHWLDDTAACVKPKWVIANEVREFITHPVAEGHAWQAGAPELWGYCAAYDHVALAQLWGPMKDMPVGIPFRTNDLAQLTASIPAFERPVQDGALHNALADARWNYALYCAAEAHIDLDRHIARTAPGE